MIEFLKPGYNAALNPFAKLCIKIGITPNAITIIGVVLSFIAAYCIAFGSWGIAAVVISIAACMDGLDGLVARLSNQKSLFGAVFDSTCDRITEFIWFLGISIYFLHGSYFVHIGVISAFCAMASSFMVSYIRARCEGERIQCSRGIMQRPERIIILVFCLLCGMRVMIGGLVVITVLGVVTVCQRLIVAKSASPR